MKQFDDKEIWEETLQMFMDHSDAVDWHQPVWRLFLQWKKEQVGKKA